MGFTKLIVPADSVRNSRAPKGLEFVPVHHIAAMLQAALAPQS